jgi:hypothetical protein
MTPPAGRFFLVDQPESHRLIAAPSVAPKLQHSQRCRVNFDFALRSGNRVSKSLYKGIIFL